MIEWIFFDLGSTLLDEEDAYVHYINQCVRTLNLLGLKVTVESYS